MNNNRAMKEVRRIRFTGKNLNDVFNLDCVDGITKLAGKMPMLNLRKIMMRTEKCLAFPGDELVDYGNGMWEAIDITQTSATADE